MSVYVVSDVHNRYDLLCALLEKINFQNEDTLIINGDLFDRYFLREEYLDFLFNSNNIELILGNHDYYLMKSYEAIKLYNIEPEEVYERFLNEELDVFELEKYAPIIRWFNNGGAYTYKKLIQLGEIKSTDLFEKVYIKLNEAVTYIVSGNYFISHTGPYICGNPDKSNNDVTLENLISEHELIKKTNSVELLVEDRDFAKNGDCYRLDNLDVNIIYGHSTVREEPCRLLEHDSKIVININHTYAARMSAYMSLYSLDDNKLYSLDRTHNLDHYEDTITVYDIKPSKFIEIE